MLFYADAEHGEVVALLCAVDEGVEGAFHFVYEEV
jgi:hypothetical protein